MKVEVESENQIRISALHEPGIGEEPFVDAIGLLGCALAQCTFGVLRQYGERLGLEGDDLNVVVKWEMTDGPKRVGAMSIDVNWPSLPESRLDAATRAARHCPVHSSFTRGMEVDVFVDH